MFCRVRPENLRGDSIQVFSLHGQRSHFPFLRKFTVPSTPAGPCRYPFLLCVSLFSFSTCCITSKNSQCFDFHGLFLFLFSRFLYCRETESGIQRSCHMVFSMYLVSLIIPDEKLLFVEFVPRLVQWPCPGLAVLFAASCNIISVG